MATPSYNAQPKLDFIDSTVTDLSANAILLQKDVSEKLTQFLAEFDTKGGRFVEDSRATTILNDIEEEVKKIIGKSKYKDTVLKLIRNYDEITKFNIKAQKSINGLTVSMSDVDKFRQVQINDTVSQLLNEGVDVNFVNPLTQALMNNILLGSTITETRDYLRTYTIGNEQKEGVLQRYSTQIARSLLYTYDGKINQQISDDYGLNAVMYQGSLIADSRGQCVRWVGMGFILKDNLQAEIDLAYANAGDKIDGVRWGGMTPGTTPSNFLVNAGGHCCNCRHTVTPFRVK